MAVPAVMANLIPESYRQMNRMPNIKSQENTRSKMAVVGVLFLTVSCLVKSEFSSSRPLLDLNHPPADSPTAHHQSMNFGHDMCPPSQLYDELDHSADTRLLGNLLRSQCVPLRASEPGEMVHCTLRSDFWDRKYVENAPEKRASPPETRSWEKRLSEYSENYHRRERENFCHRLDIGRINGQKDLTDFLESTHKPNVPSASWYPEYEQKDHVQSKDELRRKAGKKTFCEVVGLNKKKNQLPLWTGVPKSQPISLASSHNAATFQAETSQTSKFGTNDGRFKHLPVLHSMFNHSADHSPPRMKWVLATMTSGEAIALLVPTQFSCEVTMSLYIKLHGIFKFYVARSQLKYRSPMQLHERPDWIHGCSKRLYRYADKIEGGGQKEVDRLGLRGSMDTFIKSLSYNEQVGGYTGEEKKRLCRKRAKWLAPSICMLLADIKVINIAFPQIGVTSGYDLDKLQGEAWNIFQLAWAEFFGGKENRLAWKKDFPNMMGPDIDRCMQNSTRKLSKGYVKSTVLAGARNFLVIWLCRFAPELRAYVTNDAMELNRFFISLLNTFHTAIDC